MGWGNTSGFDGSGVHTQGESRQKESKRDRERCVFYCSENGTIRLLRNFRVYFSGTNACIVCTEKDSNEAGCTGEDAINFITTNKNMVIFIDPDGQSKETYVSIRGTHPIYMLVCTGYVRANK